MSIVKIDFNKHIWEGWTVGDFIEELEPLIDMVMTGQSWKKPFTSKVQVKEFCVDNQPYYKKYILEVVEYFCNKYKIV